jgi:CHAD domain-containing protein
VLDVREVEALHDMRIAAKRLRYVLEVTAEPCFGPYARTAAKRTRDLQDLIGDIHDCDVGLPRVRAAAEARRRADADALLARVPDGARDLDPALAAGLPHAEEHRGLATLESYLVARRALLYGRFLALWEQLGREGFRARLEFALAERPGAFTPDSPDGNVGVTRSP